MEKNLVEVNFNEHYNYSLLAKNSTEQVQQLNIVSIGLNEVQQTSQHYPLVWVKSNETGHFKLVALFGFEQGENIYCQSDLWHTVPTPLSLKSEPFYLGYNGKGAEERFKKYLINSATIFKNIAVNDEIDKQAHYEPSKDVTLCVDKNSKSIEINGKNKNRGLPFYQSNNQQGACLQNARGILATLTQGEALTEKFLKKINSLKLMQPLKLDIKWQDNTSADISGLYTIDPQSINLLKQRESADLQTQGYLQIIYQLNDSLQHIQHLVQLKNNLLKKQPESLY